MIKVVNCREEFIDHVFDKKIKCVFISVSENPLKTKKIILQERYNESDLTLFYEKLGFDYMNYNNRQIHGTIWYEDGTWSERIHCNIEYWEHRVCPEIPEELKSALEKT